jgi:hypothetical protein
MRQAVELLASGSLPATVPGDVRLVRGPRLFQIPGKDFADALLSVWLGPKPIGGTLKRQLLAG